MLKELLRHGAKPEGDPRGCHAVALDARAPKFDGGIVTRLDSVPFGIVVNKKVKRFYDEGEDFWPKRYAIWGKTDRRATGPDRLLDHRFQRIAALHAVGISAGGSRLDRRAGRSIGHRSECAFAASSMNSIARCVAVNSIRVVLDECRTEGLDPPKSHWARPIDTPPYYGYPLRPGITFTYLGVTVNEQAQVIMQDDRPAKNVFAAGEVMAGNILGQGYLAGFGLTIGSVFGRIAGREAARCAGF